MVQNGILKEMRESIGTKDPIVYFTKLVDVLETVLTSIDHLTNQNVGLQIKTALAIKWEPKLALDLLDAQIKILRDNKDVFHAEISAFKQARMENQVTQTYDSFCTFWQDTLGYHPFLNYKL